jgi:hypothetical protein
VLNTVRITPTHTGILNNMLNAKAVPNTALKNSMLSKCKTQQRKEINTVIKVILVH